MLKKIIFIICMLIGILSCGNSKTLKIAVDGSEKTNLEIIGKVKEDMEKQGYKVEILEYTRIPDIVLALGEENNKVDAVFPFGEKFLEKINEQFEQGKNSMKFFGVSPVYELNGEKMFLTIREKDKDSEKTEILKKAFLSENVKAVVEIKENNKRESNAGEQIQGKRFGNPEIGFINYPEGWKEFNDPYIPPTAKEIRKNEEYSIILNSYSAAEGETAESLRDKEAEAAQSGYRKEDIKTSDITLNGYTAKKVSMIIPGKSAQSIIYTEYKEKIVYIIINGTEEEVKEGFELVNKSWNPEK